jgi:hypothetical protein
MYLDILGQLFLTGGSITFHLMLTHSTVHLQKQAVDIHTAYGKTLSNTSTSFNNYHVARER